MNSSITVPQGDFPLPSHQDFPLREMTVRHDCLSLFLVSFCLTVVACCTGVVIAKLALFAYRTLCSGIRAFQTSARKILTLAQKNGDKSNEEALAISVAVQVTASASPGARDAIGQVESGEAVEAFRGANEDAVANRRGSSISVEQLVEVWQDCISEIPSIEELWEDCLAEIPGGDEHAADSLLGEERPSGEPFNAADGGPSEVDDKSNERKNVAEASTTTTGQAIAEEQEAAVPESNVGQNSVGNGSVDEIEVDVKAPPAKIEFEDLPSPVPVEDLFVIDLSDAASTPGLLLPTPPPATRDVHIAAVTEGYSEYGYTTDYLYNKYGTPPVSTAQASGEAGDASAKGGDKIKPGDLTRLLGVNGRSIFGAGARASPNTDTPKSRPNRASMKHKFTSLLGLQSPSSRSHNHTTGNANDPSPSSSGVPRKFSRFINKVQRAARKAGSPRASATNRAENVVTFISTKSGKQTFDALLSLLTGDDLKCAVTDCSKKWSSEYKLRAALTTTREGRQAVVIASFTVEEKKGEKDGGTLRGRRMKTTVITIQPSKQDQNNYPTTEFNNYKDFVNMVRIGLAEANILLPQRR